MMGDYQWAINLGALTVLGTIGYFVRTLIAEQKQVATQLVSDQKATARDLSDLRLKVAQDYVTHAALHDIKQTLVRIEEKLDHKADK